MILDFLERAVARGKTKERSLESEAQTILQREIVDKLKELIDSGPKWQNEIRQAGIEASKIVSKVRQTDWARRMDVENLCLEIEETLNRNPASIEQGLNVYKRLSWRDLLNRKSGEVDINRAANIRGEIIGLVGIGKGSANAIKDSVEKLLARIEFLETNRPPEPPSTPEPEPPPASIEAPPAKEGPSIIRTRLPFRARRG